MMRFITGSGRVFLSLFSAVLLYAVGATVFIKSLTQDNEYAIAISREAKAQAFATEARQTRVEIDVIKSVESFKGTLKSVETEIRLMRESIERKR